MSSIDEKIVLRGRNQLTIPKNVAEARGLREGQSLVIHTDDERPGEIILRIFPQTYAGAFSDVFAGIDPEEYVKVERASWE